ncbi:hypothetical protein BH11PAT3_BH11PAT3_2110 [soil metagenome]
MKSETTSEKHFVVEVIPIIKGLPKATLSYFTREIVPLGSFVKITVRNTQALGLVTSVVDAREAKSELKLSTFALKKLSLADKGSGLSPAFIRAAEQTARYYASTVGNILGVLIPKTILESPLLMGSPYLKHNNSPSKEPLLIQLNDEERFREYKSIVRGAFARSSSVIFITPTNEDALRAFDILSRGIIDFAFTTAKKTPKTLKETLEKVQKTKHPILLVTTPAYISIDRPDLETIIIEKENSRSYRTLTRPFVDIKVFAEYLAKISGKTLILGDSVLSLKALYQEKQGKYAELSPLKWKMHPGSKVKMINMKAPIIESGENDKTFKIFSPDLEHMIKKAIDEKRKIFLFGTRKGLSPSTVCRDCGTILPCPNCKAPIVLHTTSDKERIYLCHACGATRPSMTRCDNCDSWNLIPLGIGIDRIKEEVARLHPDACISILDKDHAPTSARASATIKRFASEKGGILIGTELALLYLEKVPYMGVVSLDSLFSIPDFGINERIFYLLTRLLEKCEFESIIQTRNIGKEILTLGAKGDVLDFYRLEIKEREELRYPPFSLFIKVTVEGATSDLDKKLVFLREQFASYSPDFMKARGMKTGRIALSMILRVNRNLWPHSNLLDLLFLLPSEFLIKVDPDSIL